MASPQAENGHCRIANELLEALIDNPPEFVAARQVWDWVWRNSWGRKGAHQTEPTSTRKLADAIRISKTKAARAMQYLTETNRITRNEYGSLTIQKDYERWTEKGAPKTGADCPENRGRSAPKTGAEMPRKPGQKCPENRGRYKEKERKERKERGADARPTTQLLPDRMPDTPRKRAEVGNPEMPPEEHPDFGKLGFKRRDELTEQWKANKERFENRQCKNGCGRERSSDTWRYCRQCTICSRCGKTASKGTKFNLSSNAIVCSDCMEDGKK